MSEKKNAISVRNVNITYKWVKSFSIKSNLFNKKDKSQLIEAVKNVSFDVPEGSILGIIGKNGSGKSTMLKALAGIFSVDSGEIDLHGNTVSLLAIGVGFQKQLSGRENIMLAGLLLGFPKEFIKEKTQEIIEFSELGKFIDMPVRTYSSGMYSKLAFSITAVLETDIILIDEVLSVGDQKFKKKSFQKMKELISDEHRTVVVVSHNINHLKNLCTQVMWMHEGEIVKIGETNEVLDEYQEFMEKA